MLKILFFADTHLGFDYPIRPRIQRRRRGFDFFRNYQTVLDYAVKNQIDLIIHGGDFFFRSKIPQKVVDKAYSALLDFATNGIPFVIVPGNHERSNLPISLLLNHKNIYIFDKPKAIQLQLKGAKILLIGFPNVRSNVQKKFSGILNSVSNPPENFDISFLCMHQVIEGASVGPVGYTFLRGNNVILKSQLPSDFDFILSGHVHRKQIIYKLLGDKRIPIIYPGSTARTSFAEKDEEKGFFVFNFSKNQHKYQLKKLDFERLDTRPMIDLIVNIDTNDQGTLNDWLQNSLAQIDPNAIVRLQFIREKTKLMLPSNVLRRIMPKTMNFTIKKGLANS